MKLIGLLIMSLALWACSAQDDRSAVDYSTIEIPVERLASDDARARGRALFQNKCALCHGVRADGNGVRRQGLSGAPANFQSQDWRVNTSPRQKWEVVAYVLSVAEDGP
jgi:mono/diheme cytochrome c family protein